MTRNVSCRQVIDFLGLEMPDNDHVTFAFLGMIDANTPNSLTFAESQSYAQKADANPCISGIIAPPGIVVNRKDLVLLEVEDPRFSFYQLYNFIAEINQTSWPSKIAPSAKIHKTASIPETNVIIGDETEIGPYAVLYPNVELGAGCRVGAHTIIGCEDAEVKSTASGQIFVRHDGRVVIGDSVFIGSNCTIDQGFHGRDTVIGDQSVIANTTLVGHSARIGKNCLLLCCQILGSAIIEDNARINPSAIVSNKVRIGRNAQVLVGGIAVANVADDQIVAGNFAIDKTRFLYHQAMIERQ